MKANRYLLAVVFLLGVALGWFTRGENDGNRIELEVKQAVGKAEEVEKARWEKQVRDLGMENGNLKDKLAKASNREVTIDRMKKEIDELKARLATEAKPSQTPAETTRPPDATPEEPKR
ncbi:MAG TPA: hypothetical protein VGJ26_03775 [Pirellulales bacterium]